MIRWRQNPWLSETMVIGENSWSSFFRNIVLSPVRRPMGFRSSRRYHPNQKKWDLQFGSGPRPSNKQESCFFKDLHDFFEIVFLHFFLKFIGDQNSMQIGSGEVRGGWDWFKMIGRIVGTFWDGFWPKIHWKNYENQWFCMFFRWFSWVFPDNQGFL